MPLYDISREVMTTDPYPGDPKPRLTACACHERDGYCLHTVTMSLHAATHADAPLHFLPGGDDMASLSLEAFYGPCKVLTVPKESADVAFLEGVTLVPRMLLRGNGCLTVEAAEYLSAHGVILVGTDRNSIAPAKNEKALHTALLSRGMAILENLDLSGVKDGEYILSALPLKIRGAEGAPCRAVLIR